MSMFDIELNEESKHVESFEDTRKAYLDAMVGRILELKNDPNIDLDEADTRFSTALPLNRLKMKTVAIVGAGGLGNWQWRVLLGMGFRNIAIYDDDTVDIENIGPQAHSLLDIGIPKVEAVRQAGIQYRGVEILSRQKRVYTYGEICEDLGYPPDIVITCTDSTEFRNGFINDLFSEKLNGVAGGSALQENEFPELLLDYRMSLGDWTGYAIPVRSIAKLLPVISCSTLWFRYNLGKYLCEAVFPAEAAVQESCTERAIVYTGASVAAYSGAYIHWWLTDWRRALQGCDGAMEEKELFKEYFAGKLGFSWKMSYSSRDWLQITPTIAETKLRTKLKTTQEYIDKSRQALERMISDRLGRKVEYLDWEDSQGGDWILVDGTQSDIVDAEEHTLLRVCADSRNGMYDNEECRKTHVPHTSSNSWIILTNTYLAAFRATDLGERKDDFLYTDVVLTGRHIRGKTQNERIVTALIENLGMMEYEVEGIDVYALTDVEEIPAQPTRKNFTKTGTLVTFEDVEEGAYVVCPELDGSLCIQVIGKAEGSLLAREPGSTEEFRVPSRCTGNMELVTLVGE